MSSTMTFAQTMNPVARKPNIQTYKGQRSFDPAVLYKKLEAAKLEQDAAITRQERREATRNGTYVPKGMTRGSSSSSPTTTHTPSHPATYRTRSPPPAQQPQCTADGRPVMDHKSMLAAFNLGISELEAMSDHLGQETSRQKEFLCSRCKTPDVHISEHYDLSRRASMPPTTSRLVAVNHGSQTVYERVDIPTDEPPQYHAIPYRASEDMYRNYSRPTMPHPHDRPDWTQQSQCGDDQDDNANLFTVPSGYIFRRRNQNLPATTTVASTSQHQPQQEMHLISDAVKLIKQKERRAKRKSVIDFLKKF
ncbi:hypothetical protein Q7P37_004151 [Cladosporium fusiforme]